MLRIWGRANSSNVMKVLWLCEELGVPFERIDAGGAFGKTREPAYLAMNPNALVPTIEEPDGFTLWESNAILRYLARSRAPGNPIYPADLRLAADCDRWMDWQVASVNRPMTTVFFTYVRIPEAERDWPATDKARAEAETLWGMLDRHLAGRPFITGDDFTLADIALGIYAHRWFALPIERAEMPDLRAWYDRLLVRPGCAKHASGPLT
ncbi:glutathione S-transferase family protein [Falsiroseomonas sp.]|uniref:glutathione S-transferase family protein n=1 Tax=Falsiroseomonas sp. TaxID=2870721 RepID=UPI002733A646|nr:glutathione S-transferase family protein [Falsiroseomonas sp.]MDP3415201.1 glutathione S-transferase family protein [Falsiroseomonas sp.]